MIQTRMVTDPDEFRAILDQAREAVSIGLDCEADVHSFTKPNGKSAIDPRTFSVVGGSLYITGQAISFYFPFRHVEGANLPDGCLDEWLAFMATCLLDGDASPDAPRRWVHNQQAETQMLRNHGLMRPEDEPLGARDSMIAAWLLGYGGDRDDAAAAKFEALGLKDLRIRVLGLAARREFDDVARGRQASAVPSHEMAEYAALDAYDTAMIGEALWPRLVRAGLDTHMVEIDGPMADICRGMEEEGWPIDTDSIREFGERMTAEARAIAQRFEDATTCLTVDVENLPQQVGVFKNGKPRMKKMPTRVVKVRGGNVGNDRDCARFIFDELAALPRAKAAINKDGTPSLRRETCEHFLASHAGKLGAELLQLRFAYQTRTTLARNFVRPFLEMPPNYADGRLHSRFSVTGTATQRLASSNPNTMNCPSRPVVENGQLVNHGKAIRAAMVAGDPEWEVFCFDMSQAELRVAAHFSRDPELMACYGSDPEIDVHAGTLAKLHELGWTTATRVDAKTTNFSSMYHITPPRLAIKMKCHVDQAEAALAAFETRFSRYVEWREEACEFVKAHGYVRTLDGFRRPLDPTLHWDRFRRVHDLHWSVRNQVANSAIQGSVAGIAKIAMVKARRHFVADGLWHSHVRFRAQEHDSIVGVAHISVKEHVEAVIRKCVIEAAPLRVNMKVDGGWGKSWGEAKA